MKKINNSNKSKANQSQIELTIGSIFQHLSATLGEGYKVVREKPKKKGVSCRELIKVFDSSRSGNEWKPVVVYAFYPKVEASNRLGSIAIYCDNALVRHILICKNRSLFGIPVKESRLEMGKRPFVDVTLA